MRRQHLATASLVVAAVAITTGAVITTADWSHCTSYAGGNACSDRLNRAVGAWTALGMNALALATNILDDEP